MSNHNEQPDQVETTDAYDTFVHPCNTCGTTVHVVDGTERDHVHQTFSDPDSPAAYAWWQGYDAAAQRVAGPSASKSSQPNVPASSGARLARYAEVIGRYRRHEGRIEDVMAVADAELEQARAEVERLRGEVDRARHSARRAGLRATAAESALTEAREQLSRLREAGSKVVKTWDDFGTYEPCADCLKSGVGLVTFDSDKAMDDATDDLRAVLADVTPAVQGDTGGAPPAGQEAGESDDFTCPGCRFCAPSGPDDTKGGAK